MAETQPIDHEAWPERALMLLGLGAVFGLLFHLLIRDSDAWMWTNNPWQMAGATFVAVSGVVFAMSLERLRWSWSIAFAAATGPIVALVGWWNGAPDRWGSGEGWQFFAGVIAVALAVPLFQAARDAGRLSFAPEAVQGHVWTNLILGAAAAAFVAASFILTLLLSELFRLIGIDLLRDMLEDGWFAWMLAGGAFGGAVGLLRDRDNVLHILQKVVRAILSVLAPVLALGLLLFVLALPFTGLAPLWSQTKMTTPIVLACILGAVVLANAVIGNSAEEEARSPALRYAAMALAGVMIPLALVAAISTGKRIGQYGFTPDRLWAAVFVAAAAALAIAYLVALVRGRHPWPERLRQANIGLAAGLCVLALFLALPIVSFGAISARDQVARLQSGEVAPDRFDWAALRFDFGPAGRKALERLAASSSAIVRQRAREALGANDRWAIDRHVEGPQAAPTPPLRLVVDGGRPVPAGLADLASRTLQCQDRECRLVFVGPAGAVLLVPSCPRCGPWVFTARPDGTWEQRMPRSRTTSTAADEREERNLAGGRVEIRPVERQQVFIDGRPAGEDFQLVDP